MKHILKKPNPKKLIKETALYLVIFMAIYTAFTLYRQPVMPQIPTWQMTMLNGQVVDIDKMSQDGAVLLYFWGSWCHVCKHTSPAVNELAKDAPVLTVAVSSGDDKAVSDFLVKNNYQFKTVNDETGEIFDAWQGQVTPSYVIVKDGQVVQGFVGIQPNWLLKTRLWLARWQ